MSSFKEISPKDYRGNPFEEIGSDWMLIAAGNREKCNAMTASWGGMGVLWGKNVVFAFIRESRYTKEFADAQETLSLSFPGEKYRAAVKQSKELNNAVGMVVACTMYAFYTLFRKGDL